MSGRNFVALGIFFASSILVPAGLAQDDSALSDRIHVEMLPALTKIEAYYSRMEGRGSLRMQDEPSSPILAQFTFAVDGPSKRWTSGAADAYCNVYCIAPALSFYVRREGSSAPYTIRKLGEPDQISGSVRSILERHLFSPFALRSVSLSRMFADPSFKVTGVAAEEHGGKACIRIRYKYTNDDIKLGSGWVAVSPGEGWVIRAFECGFDNDPPGFSLSGLVEYGEMRDGVPIIRRSETVRRGKTFTEREAYEFDEVKPGTPPAEVFTLAHYGLPDIGTRARDPSVSNAPFWLFGAALCLLGIAFLARYGAGRLERRRAG